MNRNVTLEKHHIYKAIKFAKKFWNAGKSTKDFGSEDNRESESDKLADTISGKLAEIAFSIFAKREFKIDVEIDFTITDGKLAIDNGQDIRLINNQEPACKADIKGSKNIARWLLIEQHKIDEFVIDSDFYISVSLDLPIDIEKDWVKFTEMSILRACVDGYIKKSLFFDKSKVPWFDYDRGSKLYSVRYVDFVLSCLTKPYTASDLKSVLLGKTKEFNGEIHMGAPLKATKNIGIPKKYLKSAEDDFGLLFNTLAGKEGK